MTTPDLLVIGGGAIGLSIAWCAARRGARVTLVERCAIGRESSWAAAGILPFGRPDLAQTAYFEAMAEGSRLHPQHADMLRAETGIDVGYLVCGELLGALEVEDRAWVAAEVARQRGFGASVSPAPGDRYPALSDLHLVEETAQIRPPWYLRALEAGCRGRGVVIHPETSIAELTRAGDRVVGARSRSGEVFAAGATVVAAGAWSPQLTDAAPDVRPIRGQIVLLRSPAPLGPIVSVDHRYLVPRPDGRVLVGATMEDVGFDHRTTATGIGGLLEFAVRVAPVLADAAVEHTWAGLRPGTPSGEPYVGPAPDVHGLWIATGHTRQGIHLAPHTGEWIAARALEA